MNIHRDFSAGRSTQDQLLYLQNNIHNSFSTGRHLLAIFLDFTKAFGMAWPYKISKKLYALNFRGRLLIFIRNFLSQRLFSVRFAGHSLKTLELENGVPQRAVCSPNLFNLLIDDVNEEITPQSKELSLQTTLPSLSLIKILHREKNYCKIQCTNYKPGPKTTV